jgi:hemerythrin-like domain-containing protein
MRELDGRRAFLSIAGAGALLSASACHAGQSGAPRTAASAAPPPKDEKDSGEDVSATEDLMREHGVIRRVLVVYREVAARLRAKAGSVPPEAIQRAARLMRTFGEDYHERQLEEAHIFPALTKAGGALVLTVDALLAQHRRGREITDYVLGLTQKAIGAQDTGPLAGTLEAFARMYEEHTALEDTIVFPAYKKLLSPKELDEMGDKFEDIEHTTFGKDGFEDAVARTGDIEKSLGIDLATMTAPPPPKA